MAYARLFTDMGARSPALATGFYRLAAKLSARVLSRSPVVESILLHRSVSTGEVFFGRSDVDLLMVIAEEEADHGESITSLYQWVKAARLLNPALRHIDVFEPSGLASYVRADTFWGSVERRTLVLLDGKPVEIPAAAVHPDHALSKFLLLVEWFFAIAVQQRNRLNLWKTSLECWNAYASAEGLIREPHLLRSEMEIQARRHERSLTTERLEDPSYAVRFVLELADRLHRSRLPALRMLRRPLVFQAVTPPLCLPRLFVVLPRPGDSLPPEAFLEGAFPCTPEYLNLLVRARNAFLHWILPPELAEIGIESPPVPEFVRSCRHYSHPRFLLYPGFASHGRPAQNARMAVLRHAAEWVSRGEVPPTIPEEEVRALMAAGAPTIPRYYRAEYGLFRRESKRIEESMRALATVATGA